MHNGSKPFPYIFVEPIHLLHKCLALSSLLYTEYYTFLFIQGGQHSKNNHCFIKCVFSLISRFTPTAVSNLIMCKP